MSHYDYLELHLPEFLQSLGVPECISAAGLISAHGDKFYGFENTFESAGLPFAQGVAIGLLTYINPYALECRDTSAGFIRVEDWVIANKDRFLKNLPPIPTATNKEIDDAVFSRIDAEGCSSLTLGAFLMNSFRGVLPAAGKHSENKLHNAQEHANRSCQRLRKRGLLTFDSKRGWLPAASPRHA